MIKNYKIAILMLSAALLCGCSDGKETPTTNAPDSTTSVADVSVVATLDETKPTQVVETTTDGVGEKENEVAKLGSNYYSTYGRIAYKDGVTYFVQNAKDLTGVETGYPDSENIYMLRDGEKKPELLAVIPAPQVYGVAQMGVFYLYPTDDAVYYLSNSGQDITLMGIDLNTKNIFEAVPVGKEYRLRNMPVISDGRLFLRYNKPDAFGVLEFDPKSKTLKDLDLSFIENEEPKYFVDIHDGYTYYVKLTSDLEPYGLFRADEKGNEQDVCALPQDDDVVPFIMGDYAVYRSRAEEFGGRDGVIFVDIESGLKYYVLSKDEFWNDANVNVFGDHVYYIDNKRGISRKQITGGAEAEQLMEGRKDFDTFALAIINDDLLLINDDDMAVYRTALTGRVLPAVPIIKSLADSYEDKQEGDWVYTEYENSVNVLRYLGSETEVTIPDQIGGKPVTIVSLWQPSTKEEHIRKLTIPDTVVSIHNVEDRSINTLIIPKSVKYFTSRGFEHSVNIAKGATIIFTGSEAEWQALIKDSAERFADTSVDTGGTEDPVIMFEGK
ncbi:MAG: hypothetical protein IK125_10220 [Lachnospiraceae bacterium]|nr:hypothetical protein [Lachnospiraceae bacterium]